MEKRKSPKSARIAAARVASNAGHSKVEAVAHRVIGVVAVADSHRATAQVVARHRTVRVARAGLQASVHRQDRIIARIKPRTNPRTNQGSPRARQSPQQVVMPRVVTPKKNSNRKPGRKAVAAAVAAVVAVAVQVKTAILANKQRPRVIPLKLEMPTIHRIRLAMLQKMMTIVATAQLQKARIIGSNSLKETK